MQEQKLLDIEKLFKQIQEDKTFAQKFTQQDNIENCVKFLTESGYNLDAKTILTLGNICINEYVSTNNSEIPDEILEQVVGGSGVKDFFKGFCYGFTHPISSIVDLCSSKGRDKLAKKLDDYSFGDFGDYVVGKIV